MGGEEAGDRAGLAASDTLNPKTTATPRRKAPIDPNGFRREETEREICAEVTARAHKAYEVWCKLYDTIEAHRESRRDGRKGREGCNDAGEGEGEGESEGEGEEAQADQPVAGIRARQSPKGHEGRHQSLQAAPWRPQGDIVEEINAQAAAQQAIWRADYEARRQAAEQATAAAQQDAWPRPGCLAQGACCQDTGRGRKCERGGHRGLQRLRHGWHSRGFGTP
jgi:hypothetical protein